MLKRKAKKKGVPSHKVIPWIRKQVRTLIIHRVRKDGKITCSVPCTWCRKEINKYGLRVSCIKADGSVFKGYMTDSNAPESKLTSGQMRKFNRLSVAEH